MNVIRILPEKVASQIAAGEVVDRPASIVRELVDNAIDAGAERISIRFESGGKRLIKVSDDGVGMSRDDLLLCLERHATSKIETTTDLFSIKSLGFRGEALPSIAAVSRMRITSRPHDQRVGHRVKVEGGRFIGIEETGAPAGTIVEVRDLFYNLPARRKFLRAARTESGHVVDVVSRVTLPFSEKSFRLDEDGKTLINLSVAGRPVDRLSALMGRTVAESLINVKGQGRNPGIQAHLAPPDLNRSRGDRLFVYVNGRNVRDRLVTKAIMEGYGQRLMKGRYPQAVVFIEMDPSGVDVNVHPTKQEVRFHNSRIVFETIVSTIKKGLAQPLQGILGQGSCPGLEAVQQAPGRYELLEPPSIYSLRSQAPDQSQWTVESQPALVKDVPEIIGQLGNLYILCQTKDGLLVVDQHAAHERVVYETLKKGLKTSHIEVQILLMPHRLELNLQEKRIALEKQDALSRMGIELDHFGGNTFLLRAVPALLKDVVSDSFLSELLAEFGNGDAGDDRLLDRVLTVMACHGAIRAGYRMAREEMAQLLMQLADMDLPTNCPHGRPIFKRFTYGEMERMFRRVL
jgi:DNA mismatch repair protein MutL